MYKKFFGLKQSPFEIAPDPYFLFSTDQHNEAYASVYYGICSRKGFVLMTGEVGTGKTLVVRRLLELLTRQQVAFANVFNPLLSGMDFLRYVACDLGITVDGQLKSTLLLALNNFLISRYRKGLTTVLIVDEAQNLHSEVLEEIRLLTNLETANQKLLQILLVGQPELEQKLDSPELRQLKQRIALRCRLEALRPEEIQGYISRRLTQAGFSGKSESIFPDDAVAVIYHYSQGIPRLVNTLCENCLIAAFAHKDPCVSRKMVEEVATEFRLGGWAKPQEAPISEPLGAANLLLQLVESLRRRTPQPPENRIIGADPGTPWPQ